MGNCLGAHSRVENDHISHKPSAPSKFTAKTDTTSVSSTSTGCSTLSTQCSATERWDRISTQKTEGEVLSSSNLKAFTFNELKNATRNFRPESLLGEGGFGPVFKGWIDEQTLAPSKPGYGLAVAVKRLKPEGYQGHREWLTEVHYLGQLRHPNLVKLIGYCSEGDNRLLVYEFMPKGSLDNHLFRSAQPLSWAIRIKVAIGAARGLSFLHGTEPQVIYRDVKSSNILLDSEFNSKLADFGLAKAGPTGDKTHVSTRVLGTEGYAAPEYVISGRLSAKADVYSFGVVLLELLSGRTAVDHSKLQVEQNLVDWSRPYSCDRRKLFRIMDTKLEGQYPKKSAFAVAKLAFHCVRREAKLRPPMSEVLSTLEQLEDPKDAAKLQMQATRNAVKVNHGKQMRALSPVMKPSLRRQPSPLHSIPAVSSLPHRNLSHPH
ncbi:hypothetical protein J5N97_017199 [Dioscorea zingiberensis]|uniref:non-specific serine/threonine protein kinase n=1 Tax=Dioscorea zingiberensis TaxID=325984 RepID=A0A9D5CLW7_9LILI|nr:hypothetical protein J5N97_017199 [Dioscorea zingiberensis]